MEWNFSLLLLTGAIYLLFNHGLGWPYLLFACTIFKIIPFLNSDVLLAYWRKKTFGIFSRVLVRIAGSAYLRIRVQGIKMFKKKSHKSGCERSKPRSGRYHYQVGPLLHKKNFRYDGGILKRSREELFSLLFTLFFIIIFIILQAKRKEVTDEFIYKNFLILHYEANLGLGLYF